MILRLCLLVLLTPAAIAQPRLGPEHFVYAGEFRLPNRRGRPAYERFSAGGHAICFNAANGSLFVAGHPHHDLVAEVRPPEQLGPDQRAEVLRDFFDPAPGVYREQRKEFVLDTLGGLHVAGEILLSTWFRFYAVQPSSTIDDPTLAAFGLDSGAPIGDGFIHIGPREKPFHQMATSGPLFPIPRDWAKANGIGEQLLACGRGDGGANAASPKGPALFAISESDPSIATTLLYRPHGQEPAQWNACDRWRGAAWIRAGDHHAVVWIGEKGLTPSWYGKPNMPDHQPSWFPAAADEWRDRWKTDGPIDRWRTHKGYHCEKREVRMLFYSPAMFAEVIKGSRNPSTILPYEQQTLDTFHEAAVPKACAYDEKNRRLFVVEYWPMVREGNTYPGTDPRIHVYQVTVPGGVGVLEQLTVRVGGEDPVVFESKSMIRNALEAMKWLAEFVLLNWAEEE